MAEEQEIESVKELEITSAKYKYSDLDVSLKKYADKTIHDMVVALKGEGKSQEINGDNIFSFREKAKVELVTEAIALKEIELEK